MNEIERIMENIHNEYAKFQEERADDPTHIILGLAERQALKYRFPYPKQSGLTVVTYLGMEIINREDVIIVDSHSSKPKVKRNEKS